jgi:hypothetical protein
MRTPHIPLEFDFHSNGHGGFHIASGDTGAFWFGLLMATGTTWNLWQGFREGGDFGRHMWIFPAADRQHPVMFWAVAVGHVGLLLVSADLIVSGLLGTRSLIFN